MSNIEVHKISFQKRTDFGFCWRFPLFCFRGEKSSGHSFEAPFFFKKKKKIFMAPFYGWGLTASRLDPTRGRSLLFTTKFPEVPGTHFIDLGRMKGLVDLGTTQWSWTRDLWIGNPTSYKLLLKDLIKSFDKSSE